MSSLLLTSRSSLRGATTVPTPLARIMASCWALAALPMGNTSSRLACGRGMTWTETSSPTRRAAAAPASVAAFTAATSPRTIAVTYGADFLPPDQSHLGGLDHGVGRLNHLDQA